MNKITQGKNYVNAAGKEEGKKVMSRRQGKEATLFFRYLKEVNYLKIGLRLE